MTYTREDLEGQWRPMVRVARSVLGCPHEAEECAAEAIVQVLERTPNGVDNLEAFMVTVAKRRAVDRLRALDRARRRDQRLAVQCQVSVADVAEDVVARAEARWIQEQAQRRLSPQSYRILQAVADGEAMHAVATRENLTVRAAQSDLFRTRRQLRAVWARAISVLAGMWAATRRSAVVSAPALAAVAGLMITSPAFSVHQAEPMDQAVGGAPEVQHAAFVHAVPPRAAPGTSPRLNVPTSVAGP